MILRVCAYVPQCVNFRHKYCVGVGGTVDENVVTLSLIVTPSRNPLIF